MDELLVRVYIRVARILDHHREPRASDMTSGYSQGSEVNAGLTMQCDIDFLIQLRPTDPSVGRDQSDKLRRGKMGPDNLMDLRNQEGVH